MYDSTYKIYNVLKIGDSQKSHFINIISCVRFNDSVTFIIKKKVIILIKYVLS